MKTEVIVDRTERIVLNYIVQIRKPFSLQQVVDNTGVPKTSCFRVFKQLIKDGKIYRTRDGQKPKLYRYKLAEERQRTAKEEGRYIFDQSFIKTLKELEEFSINDVAEKMNCSYSQAKRHINNLRQSGEVQFLRRDNRKWIYGYDVDGKPIDSTECVIKAISSLEKNNIEITKRNIAKESNLSIPTVKVVLTQLIDSKVMEVERVEKTVNIYRRIS